MTAFRRRLPKALQHLGIEGMTQTFRQIGQENDADDPRPPVDQTAGHLIGMKVHLVGQSADPLPGLLADARIIMQRPADCRRRYPRRLGQVLDRTFHRAPRPFCISVISVVILAVSVRKLLPAPLRANVCMLCDYLTRKPSFCQVCRKKAVSAFQNARRPSAYRRNGKRAGFRAGVISAPPA